MSAAKNTGGPAFPLATAGGSVANGMDLRDYFAAKAMQAIISGQPIDIITKSRTSLALVSYGFADAMIAERSKP